jgi:hypothetical protein
LFVYAGAGSVIKNVTIESGTVSSTNYACGVACLASGLISQCANYATITTTGTSNNIFAGGINCVLHSTGIIENCVNGGNVTHKSTGTGGGAAGISYAPQTGSLVTKCFNFGAILSDLRTANAIRVVGGTITNCYYDNQTSLAADATATGRTTVNCQGTGVLTEANKLSGLGEGWKAQGANKYPVPIRTLI